MFYDKPFYNSINIIFHSSLIKNNKTFALFTIIFNHLLLHYMVSHDNSRCIIK